MINEEFNKFINCYDDGESPRRSDQVELAKSADLTLSELEALWRIEQWVNQKIPKLLAQAHMPIPSWSIKCRAFKPLTFLHSVPPFPNNMCAIATSESYATRFITIPRDALPLFLADNDFCKNHQSAWNIFWQEASNHLPQNTNTALSMIAENAKDMKEEDRKLLYLSCLSSAREWAETLPDTLDGMREALSHLSSTEALKRLIEARLISFGSSSIATKREFKAVLIHEYGHHLNNDCLPQDQSKLMKALGMLGKTLVLSLVAYLTKLGHTLGRYANPLLILICVLLGLSAFLLKQAFITYRVFEHKLREIRADELVYDLSEKYCQAFVPWSKRGFAEQVLRTEEKAKLQQVSSNVFGRIFKPFELRIHSHCAYLFYGLKNPETIPDGGIDGYVTINHLEPGARWNRFKTWVQKR